MKKFTLFVIFMAVLLNVVFADESTPQNENLRQKIQQNTTQTSPQFSQNATQNSQILVQNSQNSPQIQPKASKKGSSNLEIGIGYVHSSFKARQSWGGWAIGGTNLNGGAKNATNNAPTGFGWGLELFLNENYYVGDSWGLALGLGVEFLRIKWQTSLYKPYETSLPIFEQIKKDFGIDGGVHLGLFKELFDGYLRLFGKVGFVKNWLFSGFYNKNSVPMSLPLGFGVSWRFAKGHAIEFVGKCDLLKRHYNAEFEGLRGVPSFETNIRRLGVALRYVVYGTDF